MTISKITTKYSITLIVILAVVGFIAFSVFQDSKPVSDLGRSVQPEGTEYLDMNGEPVNLSDYKNKTLVINSWASWCPFCVQELPDLNKLAGEYVDYDVVVLAINRKEHKNTATAFLNHVGELENIVFLLDDKDNYYSSIGGFTMPETVFYNKDGSISFHKRGFMNFEEMKLHLDNALADNYK